jgi:hypothetical protein
MITTPKENKYNYKIKQEKGNISGSNKILWVLIRKKLIYFSWGNQSRYLEIVMFNGLWKKAQYI